MRFVALRSMQPEQIAQLCALVQAECEYHAASHTVLAHLLESLKAKCAPHSHCTASHRTNAILCLQLSESSHYCIENRAVLK